MLSHFTEVKIYRIIHWKHPQNLRTHDLYLLSIQFWSTPYSELQWKSKLVFEPPSP